MSAPSTPKIQQQPFESDSVEQTIDIATAFAAQLKAGDVVCLSGDLGAGKTHFVKGIARFVGVSQQKVQSPTFSLIHEYGGNPPLYHFDMYRLESTEQAMEIGVEDYLYDTGICVVEWPERIASIIPLPYWMVEITQKSPTKREILIRRVQ